MLFGTTTTLTGREGRQAVLATVWGQLSFVNVDDPSQVYVSEIRGQGLDYGDKALIKAYDVALAVKPDWSNRTSYVIAPNGKILLSHTDGNFMGHVSQTMGAVKAYQAAKK